MRRIFPLPEEEGWILRTVVRGDLVNYTSCEENREHAIEDLERLESHKYLFRLSAEEADRDFKRRTLSRLGLILKEKGDKTLKKRVIVDMRRSNGNLKSHLPECLVLPRPLDAVQMVRDLGSCNHSKSWPLDSRWGSDFILIDVTDAFICGVYMGKLDHGACRKNPMHFSSVVLAMLKHT